MHKKLLWTFVLLGTFAILSSPQTAQAMQSHYEGKPLWDGDRESYTVTPTSSKGVYSVEKFNETGSQGVSAVTAPNPYLAAVKENGGAVTKSGTKSE